MVPVLFGSRRYDKIVQPPANLAIFMPTYFLETYKPSERGLRVADIGVGVAAIVGARVGFSPGELLDFTLGIVGVDIGNDDRFPISEFDSSSYIDEK